MSVLVGQQSTTYVVPPGHVELVLSATTGRLAYLTPDGVLVELERHPNWCGRWTLQSGVTEYAWADAEVVRGTAEGDADTDPLLAHVVAAGLPVDPDEYSIEADRLVLTSSPPAPSVGEVLTARVYRALT